MSQFVSSRGQSIGASASVFPMNIQGWFPLGLAGFQLLNIIFRFSSLSGREMPWVQNCAFNQELTHITRMQNGHMCQSSAPRSISGSIDDSRNLQKNYSSFKSLLNVFMVVIARYGAERICFCCLFLFFRGQNHSYHSRKWVSHVCNYMSENP